MISLPQSTLLFREIGTVCVFYYYYFQHNMREISSYRSMQAVKCSEEHQSLLVSDTFSFSPA